MEKIIDKVDTAIRAKGYKSVILEGKHFDVAAFYRENIPGSSVYGILADEKGISSGIIDNYNGTYIMWLSDKGHCKKNDYCQAQLEELIKRAVNDLMTDAGERVYPEDVIERYAMSHSLRRRLDIVINRRTEG